MGKYDDDLVHMMDPVERLLQTTENPLHRAILKNYRRHALLEVSGRFAELMAPDMMVRDPSYRIIDGARTTVIDGLDAVRALYQQLGDTGCTVMWLADEDLAVADWGFASENTFFHLTPGKVLAAKGDDVDVDAMYLVRNRRAFVWPYTRDGLLIGEHVYEDHSTREITKVAAADEISPSHAAELLAPVLDRVLPLWDNERPTP